MESPNLRRADLCCACTFVERVPRFASVSSFLNEQVMIVAWMALASIGSVAVFRKAPIGAALGAAAGVALAIYTRVCCKVPTEEAAARQKKREALRRELLQRRGVGEVRSRMVLRQLTALVLKMVLAACALYATYALTHWMVRKASLRVVRYVLAPLIGFFGGFIFVAKGVDGVKMTRPSDSLSIRGQEES